MGWYDTARRYSNLRPDITEGADDNRPRALPVVRPERRVTSPDNRAASDLYAVSEFYLVPCSDNAPSPTGILGRQDWRPQDLE